MAAPTPITLVLHASHGEYAVRKLMASYPGVPVITTDKAGRLAVLAGSPVSSLLELPRRTRGVVWIGIPAGWVRDQMGAGKRVRDEALSNAPYSQLMHTFVGRGWGEVKQEARIHAGIESGRNNVGKRMEREREKLVAAVKAMDAKVVALAGRWRRTKPPPFFVPQELR